MSILIPKKIFINPHYDVGKICFYHPLRESDSMPMRTQNETGFTLVELAIAITIIALLIGGVMKSQELLMNSRMNRTMKQFQNYEQAVITFKDSYSQLPGDIATASERLAGCSTSPCNAAGNENGFIGPTITDISTTTGALGNTSENRTMWLHLAAAGLVSDVDVTGTTAGWGKSFPASPYGGGFIVGAYNAPEVNGHVMNMGDSAGNDPLAGMPATVATMPTRMVALMDRKYDDGRPGTGMMWGVGNVTGATYGSVGGSYDEASSSNLSRPHWRMSF